MTGDDSRKPPRIPGLSRGRPQELMAGRYVLGEEWAQGGMARVFRGELRGSKGFSRPVAIKRMLPALGDDPEFARLFVEEARVVSVLSHPNIVSVLDLAVDEDERLCIVMEWVEGVDMGTWRGLHARSGARTEWEHVARVGLHVARALAAARSTALRTTSGGSTKASLSSAK